MAASVAGSSAAAVPPSSAGGNGNTSGTGLAGSLTPRHGRGGDDACAAAASGRVAVDAGGAPPGAAAAVGAARGAAGEAGTLVKDVHAAAAAPGFARPGARNGAAGLAAAACAACAARRADGCRAGSLADMAGALKCIRPLGLWRSPPTLASIAKMA